MGEHQIATTAATVRRVVGLIAADPRVGFILVAWHGSTPVGVAYASAIVSIEHGGASGWLEELYVVPHARRRGVGTRLLNDVLAEATRRGWRALDLEVEAGHDDAARIYQTRGFRQRTRQRWYFVISPIGNE
jgi:GNAT superfamily N-acetyltransferase